MSEEPEQSSDYHARFGGIARLYGETGLERLRGARVVIIGLGGVGTWAAESLARSGIGSLRLVDLDDICVTNVNRQLHALDGNIGKSKARALAERIRLISPECEVEVEEAFYTAASSDRLLEGEVSYVIDAIDSRRHKAHLLAECRDKGIPVITCGGAGGRSDATRIEVDDFCRAHGDPLLNLVRRKLRDTYGFPRGDHKKPKTFRIEAVFSAEVPVFPTCDGNITKNRKEATGEARINCDTGYGSATHLTGTFGFVAAGRVIQHIAHDSATPPRPNHLRLEQHSS